MHAMHAQKLACTWSSHSGMAAWGRKFNGLVHSSLQSCIVKCNIGLVQDWPQTCFPGICSLPVPKFFIHLCNLFLISVTDNVYIVDCTLVGCWFWAEFRFQKIVTLKRSGQLLLTYLHKCAYNVHNIYKHINTYTYIQEYDHSS